jgi:hypothetical protein
MNSVLKNNFNPLSSKNRSKLKLLFSNRHHSSYLIDNQLLMKINM